MVLGAVVLIEDELYLIFLDTVARVLHLDENAVGLIYLANKDLLVLARVVYSVIDKVIDDLFYLHHIAVNYSLLIGSEVYLIAVFLGKALETVHYLAQLCTDVEFRRIELLLAALQLGEVQHIIYEESQTVGLADDYFEMLIALNGIIT